MDWKKLKAEYIAGGTSYRKLAEKYGVPRSNIERRAKAEKWAELRGQAEAKAEAKMVETISRNHAKNADKIISVADKLLDKIGETIEQMDVMDTQSIKHLSSALKDLRDIKGYKSEADIREQEARIAKLQKDAMAEEKESNEIKVVIEGSLEKYSE